MKILILNKPEFGRFMEYNMIDDDNVETQNAMFISINPAYCEQLLYGRKDAGIQTSYFKRQHSNVMIMHFGDYGEEYVARVAHEGPTGIFNPFKAKKLYEFIKRNKDKRMAIVHCSAGISRSGAVGTFIFDLYGRESMTYEEFLTKNRRIQPNQHVIRLLNDELRKDK